jgi:transcriptional regulator with XRE-family HTH domain
MIEPKHIGRNLRHLRLLKGMKQVTFARELGIAQQNVSKMENKKEISMEKLEAAAKALGITVDAIEKFNEKVYLNNNIALEQNAGQIVHPINEVIEYFKDELLKRDTKNEELTSKIEELTSKIEELTSELEEYRKNKRKSTKPKEPAGAKLKSMQMVEEKKAAK